MSGQKGFLEYLMTRSLYDGKGDLVYFSTICIDFSEILTYLQFGSFTNQKNYGFQITTLNVSYQLFDLPFQAGIILNDDLTKADRAESSLGSQTQLNEAASRVRLANH